MEGGTRALYRDALAVSTTAPESGDQPKRQEIKRRLCENRDDNPVARNSGEPFCRLEQHLPAGSFQIAGHPQGQCTRPSYAFDRILSVPAEIPELGRRRGPC